MKTITQMTYMMSDSDKALKRLERANRIKRAEKFRKPGKPVPSEFASFDEYLTALAKWQGVKKPEAV